jgi:tetratricopeptide (TPR) repeat protein
LLRALNVEGERIPSTTSERANLYRALLSGRRSIVVLDNAGNAAQVRPLIPGSGSVVLVTSRDPLTELEGALRFGLRVLPPADAAALLGAIVGARRVAAEPEAARALAEACGHLPLALRIVAAKLATREHWRLGRMASRLADEGRRLSELEAGDLAVRASFASSYDGLDPALQRCFRLAALHPGPSFTAWALAALNDVDVEDAEELAERLAELNLLEFAGDDETAQPRYRFHDLMRLFAREQLQSQDSPTEQRAALERELGAYLTVSARGLYLLSPHSKRDPDPTLARRWPLPPDLVEELLAQPYAWFAAEHAGLVALVVRAHELQLWAQTYELAEKLHYYFRVGGHLADWQSTHRLALEAARAAGDRRAEAWTRRNLGNANQDEGRFAEAVTCFDEAARVFQDLGLVLGTAAALCNLGETYLVQGRFAAARDNLTRCLPYWRAAGDDVGVAYTLDNLALLRHYDDEPAAADDGFAESLALFRTLADTFGEAHCLRRRADLHTDLGRFTEAEAELRAAQEIFLRMGSPASVTWTSIGQARLMLRQGNPGAAVERAAEAVRAFQALDVRRPAAQGMVDLGAALDADGRGPEAESVLTQALTLLRDQEDDFGTARAHFELGRCAASRGDTDAAREFLRTAADAFAALPAALWTRRASDELAGIEPV